MGDLLIRDLPERTHDELERRAQAAGMSLQADAAQVLGQHTVASSLDEWLRDLAELPRHPEISSAETIRAVRDVLP